MADLSKDVLAFSEELKRMCRAYPECEGCPAYGEMTCDARNVTPKLIDAVQKWSDEHTGKTYAQDFREKFPNCTWWDDGDGRAYPRGVCKNKVYRNNSNCDYVGVCKECWNEPMPEEETS